ncbi:expressed unknown protein [Seminavis robusta]|uniref:Uncharacterized protein n=1 Tax=Seminavis robusta TaxID=568900 RepID=A0A9N8EYJ6_9STRA|nr:expressed unknown protein [Seminavis robusta]|eukprot:Sro2297_g322410.1 n/a (1602) ;mRNA; r:5238-10043
MLPVASPQHTGNDRGVPLTANLDMGGSSSQGIAGGGHQESQGDNNVTGGEMNSIDLDSFRNQKIKEFREALEVDIQRKRQQAQKDLEAAERQKWEQLMEFQQALQREQQKQEQQKQEQQQRSQQQLREFQQAFQREQQQALQSEQQQKEQAQQQRSQLQPQQPTQPQYVPPPQPPPPNPANYTQASALSQQQSRVPGQANLPQQPSPSQQVQQQQLLLQPVQQQQTVQQQPVQQQQQQQGMARVANPLHQQQQAVGIQQQGLNMGMQATQTPSANVGMQSTAPNYIQQHGQSMGIQIRSSMQQTPQQQQQQSIPQGMQQAAPSVYQQQQPPQPQQSMALPPSSGPQHMMTSSSYGQYSSMSAINPIANPMRQQQQYQQASPMRQLPPQVQPASPMVQLQAPPNPTKQQLHQGASPVRQLQAASPARQHISYNSIQHQNGQDQMAQQAVQQQVGNTALSADRMYQSHDGGDFDVANSGQYHEGASVRIANPMRQHQGMGTSVYTMYNNSYMGRTGSSTRQYDKVIQSSPMRQYEDGRSRSPMRYHADGRSGSPLQQHDDRRSRSPTRHRIDARSGSPLRQYEGGRSGSPIRYHADDRSGSPMRHHADVRTNSPIRQIGMAAAANPYNRQGSEYSSAYDANQDYHHMSRSASLSYPDPTIGRSRSPSRMAHAAPQHRSMSSSSVDTEGYYRGLPGGANDDIWRTRGEPETFTFDNAEDDRTHQKPRIPGVYSAGVERVMSHQNSRDLIHSSSTWNPSGRRVASPPSPRHLDRLDEAERLEREYAQLTGKRIVPSASKLTNLMQVKKMQEERRRKLEALTAKVVENRRRLAHEMKTADRPLEISVVERLAHEMDVEERLYEKSLQAREGHRTPPRRPRDQRDDDELRTEEYYTTPRRRQSDKREKRAQEETRIEKRHSPSSKHHRDAGDKRKEERPREERRSSHRHDPRDERREELPVVVEVEEPTETDTGTGMRTEEVTHSAARPKHHRKESHSEYRSEEPSGSSSAVSESDEQVRVSESKPNPTRKSASKTPPKSRSHDKHNRKAEAKSKKKERKGKTSADEFLEKLRQKRSEAAARLEVEGESAAYDREDFLNTLETGKAAVTLPTRDPKLARKNRKLPSLKLTRESHSGDKGDGRISPGKGRTQIKIVTKKSKTSGRVTPTSGRVTPTRVSGRQTPTNGRVSPTNTRGSPTSGRATPKAELEKAVARDLDLTHDVEESRDVSTLEVETVTGPSISTDPTERAVQQRSEYKSPSSEQKANTKKHTVIMVKKTAAKPTLEQQIAASREKERGRKERGASSTVSLVSDMSESVFAVAPIMFDNDSVAYTDEPSDQMFSDLHFDDIVGSPSSSVARVYLADDDTTAKHQKLKVREFEGGSETEGFEVEEGTGSDTGNSRSNKAQKEPNDPPDSRKHNEKPMSNLEALHELERKLDAEDRRNLMPELLELTELYGWDMKKLLQNVVQFLPHLSSDGLSESSLQHLLSLPVKAFRSPRGSPATSPIRATSSRKIPVTYSTDRRSPSSRSTAEVAIRDGWRSRTRNGPATPRTRHAAASTRVARVRHRDDGVIDMGDVRSSLKSILKRNNRVSRTAYKPELNSLNEH